jgi:hypothetical protein
LIAASVALANLPLYAKNSRKFPGNFHLYVAGAGVVPAIWVQIYAFCDEMPTLVAICVQMVFCIFAFGGLTMRQNGIYYGL